jgi:hypothetical protein
MRRRIQQRSIPTEFRVVGLLALLLTLTVLALALPDIGL